MVWSADLGIWEYFYSNDSREPACLCTDLL